MKSDDGLSSRWLVLGLMFSTYLLNGADRQLIAVLAEPMRKDLGLSDGQLGLLSGVLFALTNILFGVPIAWVADRVNRVGVVAAMCLFWSACTGAMGLAASFLQLAMARVGMALGQAGVSPPSYSVLADYFRPEQRATIYGIYSVGFPLGAAVGTALGGWIAAEHGWRAAYLTMVAPGVLVSAALVLLVRHPQRGRLDPGPRTPLPAPPLLSVLRDIIDRPVLWRATLAASFSGLCIYALMVWTPAFLMRAKGMPMLSVSGIYSIVSGGTQCLGMVLGGWLTDRLSRRTKRAAALIPAFAFLLSAPLVLAAIWAPGWPLALAFIVVPFVCMTMYFPPLLATVQNASRPEARSTTGAICVITAGVAGAGAGPALVGYLSDVIVPSDRALSLQWALTALMPFFVLAIAAHLGSALALGAEEKTARELQEQPLSP